jgi:hypothetical protein
MGIGKSHEHRAALMGGRNETPPASADIVIDHEKIGVAHQAKDSFRPMIPDRTRDHLK